ncbi:MAG: competence/damage-inducible protein A [Desulfosarcinaceae bacterium]
MIGEILATGDEIRTGALVDSNSAYIAERLMQYGVVVSRHQAVGDDMEMLEAVLLEISRRADIAVVTGGLGPTGDDLTAEAAARAAGCELVKDERALKEIEAFFQRRKRPMSPSNAKQAYLPDGARPLYNSVGTAPGFEIKINRCWFYCLPGVPREMERMLADQVMPLIQARMGRERSYCLVRTISTFGLPESAVGEKVSGLTGVFPDIKLGLRAKFPEIQVKLYFTTDDEIRGNALLDRATGWVREQLGARVFSETGETMAAAVGRLLVEQKATLALAESCTGGLIANWVTNTAGSSDYFLLSAVTYANQAKQALLGVAAETLKEFGAVHEQTAREMAAGARKAAGAVYGLSTTGIAGPSGGSKEKPVGTVCVAVAGPEGTVSRRLYFPFGQRLLNKRIFATAALDMLRRVLLQENLD